MRCFSLLWKDICAARTWSLILCSCVDTIIADGSCFSFCSCCSCLANAHGNWLLLWWKRRTAFHLLWQYQAKQYCCAGSWVLHCCSDMYCPLFEYQRLGVRLLDVRQSAAVAFVLLVLACSCWMVLTRSIRCLPVNRVEMWCCLDATTPDCTSCKGNCLQRSCVAVSHPLLYLLRCLVLCKCHQSCCIIVPGQLFELFVCFVLLWLRIACSKSSLPTNLSSRRMLKSKSFMYWEGHDGES